MVDPAFSKRQLLGTARTRAPAAALRIPIS